MKIRINGESREYPESTTLAEVIEKLGIKDKVMAAAVNMEIVRKDFWNEHCLKDGDRVELLHFVGGG
jgi:sulfur carrier protein